MAKFCHYHINDSIQIELEPILCPYLFRDAHDHTDRGAYCPRLNNPNTSIHRLIKYDSTKKYWQNIFYQLKRHLGNRTIYLLGDSINGHLFAHINCLVDFAQFEIRSNIEKSEQMGFPTQLDSLIYNFSHVGGLFDRAYEQKWYHHSQSADHRIKYLVINTGAWWNPNNFQYLHNHSVINDVNVMLDIYREYFRINGTFLNKLNNLITNHNITILWRDTAPAGSCTIYDPYINYHQVYNIMNLIAHKSLKQIGVIIIPNIWKESLRYWNFHLESNGDLLHYCTFHNQSVMTSWVINIINSILEN